MSEDKVSADMPDEEGIALAIGNHDATESDTFNVAISLDVQAINKESAIREAISLIYAAIENQGNLDEFRIQTYRRPNPAHSGKATGWA